MTEGATKKGFFKKLFAGRTGCCGFEVEAIPGETFSESEIDGKAEGGCCSKSKPGPSIDVDESDPQGPK